MASIPFRRFLDQSPLKLFQKSMNLRHRFQRRVPGRTLHLGNPLTQYDGGLFLVDHFTKGAPHQRACLEWPPRHKTSISVLSAFECLCVLLLGPAQPWSEPNSLLCSRFLDRNGNERFVSTQITGTLSDGDGNENVIK